MPGMVLSILVTEGQAIQKGESVIILEAMKMENVLKASEDGVIKSIKVQQGNPVEKNQALIELE
jgi:biotin carboxyl carrier protein